MLTTMMFHKYTSKKLLLCMLASSMFALSACNDDNDDTNVNPNTPSAVNEPTLTGFARLPAETFDNARPTSGQYIKASNGVSVPFVNKQPIQGFSGVVKNTDGTYTILSDNGYGSMSNSADYQLSLYVIKPDLKHAQGGTGTLAVQKTIQLKDPNKKISFPLVNQFTDERILTGADFDPESIQRAKDGTFWIGEEFGPFLLHFSAEGVLLDAPIELPNPMKAGEMLRAPQNPYNEEGATLRYMNAMRGHAQQHGNMVTPWFAPYEPELKYNVTLKNGEVVASNPDASYARGVNGPKDLTFAASDIYPLKELKDAGFPVYAWTVNDEATMLKLLKAGISGLITDDAELAYQVIKGFDANQDGKTGDYLLEDGLIDSTKFVLQGHRGARNLRIQNTLPAFEVALDNLVTVLESDMQVTKDGKDIIGHDTRIVIDRCRHTDNSPMPDQQSESLLINRLTQAQIQQLFICDDLETGRLKQKNDLSLSPVSVLYAKQSGLNSAYSIPSMQNVFGLVKSYIAYYENGAGKSHPMAVARAKNARLVQYNLEPKSIPHNVALASIKNINPAYSVPSKMMADIYMRSVNEAVKQSLVTLDKIGIQAFDHNFIQYIQETYPQVRTGYLWADLPNWPSKANNDGGFILQPNEKGQFPWLTMSWPYRVTAATAPLSVPTSGGFEGMAQSPDGKYLYLLQEKPLIGSTSRDLLIHQFDIAKKSYTGAYYKFPLNTKATAIGDFQMFSDTEGVIIERDDSQGKIDGYKHLVRIKLNQAGQYVDVKSSINLMDLANPQQLYGQARDGDVVVGNRFGLPIWTIEGLIIESPTRVSVFIDNNYPFGLGRNPKRPDDNEMVQIDLPVMLALQGK